jgi:GT2 family glycosyltransferase
MKVSVIIVNYNAGELLLGCVRSILNNPPPFGFEVIVVDNDSRDTSIAMVEEACGDAVNIIRTGANLGFSAANNIGAAASSGDVLFFLNPDTEILGGDLWSEFDKISREQIYTTRLAGGDGKEYGNLSAIPTVANYFKKLLGRRYLTWAQGSVVIMRREVFDLLGRWPEDYFMYSEDLDLFYHAALRKIYVKTLNACVKHIGGGTTSRIWSSRDRQQRVELSYLRFSKKYRLMADYHILHLFGFFRTLVTRPAQAWFVYSVYLQTWTSEAL